jgi:hypothetical protein
MRKHRHKVLRRSLSMSERAFSNQIHELKNRKVFQCHYCNAMLTMREATIDHKQPRAKGGTNVLDNMVISCFPCNLRKGTTPYEEFNPNKSTIPKPEPVLPPRKVRKNPTKLLPSYVNGEHFLIVVDMVTGEMLGQLGPFHNKVNHALTYTSQTTQSQTES